MFACDKWIKQLTAIDIALIKLSCVSLGLFIASFFPLFTIVYKWYWLVLVILFALKPALKLCSTKKPDKSKKKGKRGAMELSIGTIVIIVLSVTMLILGLVLVRNIMCGAIGLTGEVSDRTRGEIVKLFQGDDEAVCIGSGTEPVYLIKGRQNVIYCGFKAPKIASYQVTIKDISADERGIRVDKWIKGEQGWKGDIAPNDDLPKKILRLEIPNDAPETGVTMKVEVKKEGNLFTTQDLVFQVRRIDWFRGSMC